MDSAGWALHDLADFRVQSVGPAQVSERVCGFGGKRHEQAAGGLRVGQYGAHRIVHILVKAHVLLEMRHIGERASRNVLPPSIVESSRKQRHGVHMDPGRHAGDSAELGEMPEQSVSGDIGGRVGTGLHHRNRSLPIERRHPSYGLAQMRIKYGPDLEGSGDEAGSDRFG